MLHEPSSVNVPPWQPQRTSYHEHRACMLSQVAHALLKACPVVAGAASMRRTKGMGRGGEVQCASRWTLGVVAIVQEAPRGIVVVVQEASGLVELSGGNAGGVWGKRGVHVDVSNLLSDRHARPPHPVVVHAHRLNPSPTCGDTFDSTNVSSISRWLRRWSAAGARWPRS